MTIKVVEGVGLFSGRCVRVSLEAREGPITICVNAEENPLNAFEAKSIGHTTMIERGSVQVGMVEHLFAALAGFRVYENLKIGVEGLELPLLDGGARIWCEALRAIGVSSYAPPLSVVQAGDIFVRESCYSFVPGESVHVAVTVEFGTFNFGTLNRNAEWRGDLDDFVERISSARTFVRVDDLADTLAGPSLHAAPESVVVLADEEVLSRGAPFLPDEPARHKLLDLMGDLYAYGGPPRGSVSAHRPGHRATHEAMRAAFDRGLLHPASAWSSHPK